MWGAALVVFAATTWAVGRAFTMALNANGLMNVPFLVLPGFGNSKVDYLPSATETARDSLIQSMQQHGLQHVDVVELNRLDWLRITTSAARSCFWTGECRPSELFMFYMKKVHNKVMELRRTTGKPVVLVGHSAGGWLARALCADGRWLIPDNNGRRHFAADLVCGLVTLGTPHYPPSEPFRDPSRGALTHVHNNYPGAFLKHRSKMFYLSVAGTAVSGTYDPFASSLERFVTSSYISVTGSDGEVPGDGIVPVSHALLTGAHHLVLNNTWHGPILPNCTWYGTRTAVDKWLPTALQLSQHSLRKRFDRVLR